MRFPLFLAVLLAGCTASETQTLVFSSDRDGGMNLFEMTVPGGKVQALTMGEASAYSVAWHPTEPVFVFSTRSESVSAVVRRNIETGTTDTLVAGPFYFGEPEWTSDGSHLLFVSDRDYDPLPMGRGRELYRMDLASGTVDRLTADSLYQGAPRFSPDGSRLAFCQMIPTDTPAPRAAVFVSDPDGSNARQISAGIGFDCLPSWSPDGSRLVHHRCGPETCDLWTVGANGEDPAPLREGPNATQWPSWSADGEWIAFTMSTSQQTDIYRIRPDGTGEERLTDSPSRDEAGEWRP